MVRFLIILLLRSEDLTEKRVEASVSLLLVTGHSLGVLVQTSDVLHIGIGLIVVSSGAFGQDLTSNTFDLV